MELMQNLGLENCFPCKSSCLFKYKNKKAVEDYEKSKSWQIVKCLGEKASSTSKAKTDAVEEGGKGKRKRKRKRKRIGKSKERLKSKKQRKEERERREEAKRVPAGLDPENVKELGLRIKEGKKVNIESLLTSSSRDFLVDSNGNRVKVSSLVGKQHLLIQHFELPVTSYTTDGVLCWALQRALPSWSDFQLVVVATMTEDPDPYPANLDAEAVFNAFLAGFPSHKCLGIPISDLASYHRVSGFINNNSVLSSLLVDPNGVIMHVSARYMMELGAAYFPPSESVIEAYDHSIYSLQTQRPVPLENLLGLGLDHSLSNAAATRTILVSDLKPKLVGLYLCQTGQSMDIIVQACQHCHRNNLELQVVLVYLPLYDDPSHLITCANAALTDAKEDIDISSSWWLLPFDDSTSRRLWNLCKHSSEDQFIIVGPQGEFMDTMALRLIHSSSSLQDLYPYAAEAVARQETRRLMELTLESVLSSCRPAAAVAPHNGRISARDLQGKIVCLFIADCDDNKSDETLESMAAWCRDHQGAANNYSNVVLVFVPFHSSNLNFTPPSDPRLSWLWDPTMAWLICCPDPAWEDSIIKHSNLRGLPSGLNTLKYIVFGEDGKLISMVCPDLSDIQAYGFLPDQLYLEVLDQYFDRFFYDYHPNY